LCGGQDIRPLPLIRHALPVVDPAAVDAVLAEYPSDRRAISSHGTGISLLVAQRTGVDAHRLALSLAMPDLVVLNA
jgi:hypothetical protein